MYNSREIGELRADVAVNCRTLIERAAARGLPVLVVQTVRDVEYQRYLVSMGYAARTATVPTFHAKGVGLAFDICKNVKGHEYDDPGFFTAMGRLGKEMGFTWGGDWRSFPDRPHFQWDGGGKYTSSMVRAGRYPPPMPRFEEEETMTQEQFNTLMEGYWRSLAQREPADWSAEAREWAEKNGLIVGDGNGNKQYRSFVTREQLASILYRLSGKPAVSASLRSYTDASDVSAYAVDAMRWAVGCGYLKGSGAKLNPQTGANRAEVAVLLHRYLTK